MKSGASNYRFFEFRDNSIYYFNKRTGQELMIVNTQTVHPVERGTTLKHLVLGANNVPNGMPLQDTINYCYSLNLPNFFMPGGIPFKELESLWTGLKERCTGVLGHQSQYIIPNFLSGLSAIGKYARKTNQFAENFAFRNDMPCLSVSSAHRMQDIGNSFTCMNWEGSLMNFDVERIHFTIPQFQKKGRESFLTWASWILALQRYGGRPNRFIGEKSSYNLPKDDKFYNYK